MPKKLKWGTLWDFSTSFLSQNIKKLKGDPLWNFFRKTVSKCRKTEKGDPLDSPGIAGYAEKEGKHFWFSSLGQIIQFGTIKFRRTLRTILPFVIK